MPKHRKLCVYIVYMAICINVSHGRISELWLNRKAPSRVELYIVRRQTRPKRGLDALWIAYNIGFARHLNARLYTKRSCRVNCTRNRVKSFGATWRALRRSARIWAGASLSINYSRRHLLDYICFILKHTSHMCTKSRANVGRGNQPKKKTSHACWLQNISLNTATESMRLLLKLIRIACRWWWVKLLRKTNTL